MFLRLTLALTVLLADTCNRQTLEEETLLIKEHQAPCMGVAPMQCLQVKHEQDSSWTLLSGGIEGFNYEEGYQYKLQVKVVPVKNPPADGSSLRYELVKVIEKIAVANTGLQGKRWALVNMNGVALDSSPVWIQFDTTAHAFNGNAGCNRMRGEYKAEGELLSFMQVISTRMACIDQQANERESNLLRMLNDHSYSYSVQGDALQLSDSGKVMLQFRGMPPQAE